MQLARAKVEEFYKEFKRSGEDEVEELDYRHVARDAIKVLMEEVMAWEVRVYVGAGRYERDEGRVDYLNGSYVRRLLTEVGDVEVKVPRTRGGGFRSRALTAYRRRGREVDRLIVDCFVKGMSTRKVADAVSRFLDDRVSAATVSRVGKMLDELVRKYHGRKLLDEYIYLYLDGVTVKERGLIDTPKRSVLTAYGITSKGKREIIDYRISGSESQAQWERFLNSLYSRGLAGDNLQLVVTDGGKGLINALEEVYGDVPHQGCWAHKSRNVLDKVKKQDREKVKRDLNKISHAQNKKKAVKAYWAFSNKWRDKYPKAVDSLTRDFDRMLHFMDLPKEHWNKLRTTNGIERSFREVRRRIRPMGVCSNKQSLDRILFAVFDYMNKKWQDNPLSTFTQNPKR